MCVCFVVVKLNSILLVWFGCVALVTTHEHLLCGHRHPGPQYHRQPHLQLGQLTITKTTTLTPVILGWTTNTLVPVIIGWALASLSVHCAGNRENRISVANVQNS